jgi:hypothetical protein
MVRCAAVKKKGSTLQCTARALPRHSLCGIHAKAKTAEIWRDVREKDVRITKCQSVARRWLVVRRLRLGGPGVLCRKNLANDEELVTCTEVNRQHPFSYFAFTENGKTWWFDFDSLWTWSLKSDIPTNPYTREPLQTDVRRRLREAWAYRLRHGVVVPLDPRDVNERIRCRWRMLHHTFVDNGFIDVTLGQLTRLGKASHIAMWRFLRDDAGVFSFTANHMLHQSILNSGAEMYIVNSLRNLMRVVVLSREPYENVFAVMSAIYRC